MDLELSERRIAFIGANGSGKSTLLRLLNGLVLPTTGRVLVGDLDTRRDGRRIRRQVGFVFTDPLAQLVMATPADDVELSLRNTIPDRADRRAGAARLLAQRGLAHLADQSVYDLSGGERQLVALTSVLACGPAIVVADEPTTLLDLRNRNQVRTAISELDQQVLVATHDLEMAADADRVIVIDDGLVVADGEPASAIAAYRKLMA
ncbi:MAG TPA: ABC transporter ATP-binding protein [Propionicimonas sp.]|nr:ABC transporter ATP-binding protein [Propionicimonas sp.]HQA77534.1 ABC transporter ATP-binding protein [Propionicimonas sp.]HQD96123.1 ABC transporter ATP-binding protein [Propionicimonas sp.]